MYQHLDLYLYYIHIFHLYSQKQTKYYLPLNSNLGNSYSENETVCGKWIDDSVIYRKVVYIGSLPNNSTLSVPHNIENFKQLIHLYGYANVPSANATNPLPFLSPTASNNVLINVKNNNITIQTLADRSGWYGTIILEYIKQ